MAHKKLTSAVIPQIKSWVYQGLSVDEIAERIGCTVGTLRVRCSQLSISLRHPRTDRPSSGPHPNGLRIVNSLSGNDPHTDRNELLLLHIQETTVRSLQKRAAMKGLSQSTVAAALLDKIAEDDLYDAVLDEN